jgi:hypothetical protein
VIFTLLYIDPLSCSKPVEKIVLNEENWNSLVRYNEAPEWFQNGKFGIYYCWGLLSVPVYANDWHPRLLRIEGTASYKHHVETLVFFLHE